MKRSFIVFVVFLFVPILASAQWVLMKADADSAVRKGIFLIYNFEFDSASVQFNKVIAMYPDHPAGYFLDAMVDRWRIYSDMYHAKGIEDQFLKKIDRVITVCDKLLDKNPDDIVGLFFKGGAIGFRAWFYAFERKSYLSALTEGLDAMNIVQKSWEIAPGNKDVLLGMGIYHYFAAAMPEQYPVIKPLMAMFPSGDKRGGLMELQLAAKEAQYASTEAKAVLLMVYNQFEKNYTATADLAKQLLDQYPRNAVFHAYLGRSYSKLGYTTEQESTWREILLRCMAKQTGYDYFLAREAMYYVGTALFYRKDYDEALRYFYKADEFSRKLDTEMSSWMVRTNLYIGYAYDLQGKRDLAVKQYQKILGWEEKQESHKFASRYLQQPYKVGDQ